MTIKDSIKRIFEPGHQQHSTATATANDPHIPAGTAAGHTADAQRHHASTMPQPEMESEVWPEVHGKYREASKEARLTNQNAKLAEEELEKLRLAQDAAGNASRRQAELKQEALNAQGQFGHYDSKKEELARAQAAANEQQQRAAQLAREAEAVKTATAEKQRAAEGLHPAFQQKERELQAVVGEMDANKRRAAELQQLEQQRLAAERDTGRHASALAQEKHNVEALEQQLQAAKQRVADGTHKLNQLKQVEADITKRLHHIGGADSAGQALRDLEAHHNMLGQRATAAQAALEEHRRMQAAKVQEAQLAEQRYRELSGRMGPVHADVQRAKQEAERLAAEMRNHEAQAHELAKRHQGLLSEVETHQRTLQAARTDAEKHLQAYRKYEGEAEAAHNRKQERWGEANNLVTQMGTTETTKFSTMETKIKEFGEKLFHHQGATPGHQGETVTTERTTGIPGQTATGVPGQTTTTHHTQHTSGGVMSAGNIKQPAAGSVSRSAVAEE